MLAESDAVWYIGQGIMMREMGDPFVGALAFGDIIDGCDPSPRRCRLVRDGEDAAVAKLPLRERRLVFRNDLHSLANKGFRVSPGVSAFRETVLKNSPQW